MEQVIVGVDPQKLSATIEVVDPAERKLGDGRFATDRAGYAAMLACVKAWPGRVGGRGRQRCRSFPWRSGCSRTVRSSWTSRPKLAARVRLFDTGHHRKTDAHDAHSIAAVAGAHQDPSGAAG
jgi:transposase